MVCPPPIHNHHDDDDDDDDDDDGDDDGDVGAIGSWQYLLVITMLLTTSVRDGDTVLAASIMASYHDS